MKRLFILATAVAALAACTTEADAWEFREVA